MRIPLLQEAKTSELVCPLKKLNKPHGKPEMTLKLGQFSIEKEGPDQDPRYKFRFVIQQINSDPDP